MCLTTTAGPLGAADDDLGQSEPDRRIRSDAPDRRDDNPGESGCREASDSAPSDVV